MTLVEIRSAIEEKKSKGGNTLYYMNADVGPGDVQSISDYCRKKGYFFHANQCKRDKTWDLMITWN